MQKVNLVGFLCNGLKKRNIYKTTRDTFSINDKQFTKEIRKNIVKNYKLK
jgi:DNA-binding transcriptional regulator GbsR (MarR family)